MDLNNLSMGWEGMVKKGECRRLNIFEEFIPQIGTSDFVPIYFLMLVVEFPNIGL